MMSAGSFISSSDPFQGAIRMSQKQQRKKLDMVKPRNLLRHSAFLICMLCIIAIREADHESNQFEVVIGELFTTVPFVHKNEVPDNWSDLVQNSRDLEEQYDLPKTWSGAALLNNGSRLDASHDPSSKKSRPDVSFLPSKIRKLTLWNEISKLPLPSKISKLTIRSEISKLPLTSKISKFTLRSKISKLPNPSEIRKLDRDQMQEF